MHINEQAILSAISPRDKENIVYLISQVKDSDDPIQSTIDALDAILDFLKNCEKN